jgi:uncharacterized protein (TIGR01777 family)
VTGAVFVTGATGLLGGRLCAELAREGVAVTALSRAPQPAAEGVEWLRGDPTQPGAWIRGLEGASAVVHLAGEPIAKRRWSAAQKQRLYDSRVESARRIVEALASMETRPKVLVSASATGFYGNRGEETLDESSSPGADFLARLCCDWEAAAGAAESLGVRVVCLRFGVLLSRRGGALARMLPAFRIGLGGALGPRQRWFPWIQEDDALGLVRAALAGELGGVVNAVAPGVVRMGEFATALGKVLERPAFLPLPLGLLRLGLGELADALVPGQKVVPQAALAVGHEFRHPVIEGALRACLGR